MIRIVHVGFLPCDNGHSCDLYPFGCGNSSVINRDAHEVGMQLRLWMTAPHELACYTINKDGTDGCHVRFVAPGGGMQLSWTARLCVLVLSSHQTTKTAP